MNVRMPVILYSRVNAIIFPNCRYNLSKNPFLTYWRNGQQPPPLGSSSSVGGAGVEGEDGWGATTAVGRSTVELSYD
jgi:hypothetical protein